MEVLTCLKPRAIQSSGYLTSRKRNIEPRLESVIIHQNNFQRVLYRYLICLKCQQSGYTLQAFGLNQKITNDNYAFKILPYEEHKTISTEIRESSWLLCSQQKYWLNSTQSLFKHQHKFQETRVQIIQRRGHLSLVSLPARAQETQPIRIYYLQIYFPLILCSGISFFEAFKSLYNPNQVSFIALIVIREVRDNKTFQKYRPPKYDFYNKQVIIEPRFWQIQSYNLIKGNFMLESSRFLQSIFYGIIFNFFNFIKKKI